MSREAIKSTDLIVEDYTLGSIHGYVKLYRIRVRDVEPTSDDPLAQRASRWFYTCKSPEEVQAFLRGLSIGEQGGVV